MNAFESPFKNCFQEKYKEVPYSPQFNPIINFNKQNQEILTFLKKTPEKIKKNSFKASIKEKTYLDRSYSKKKMNILKETNQLENNNSIKNNSFLKQEKFKFPEGIITDSSKSKENKLFHKSEKINEFSWQNMSESIKNVKIYKENSNKLQANDFIHESEDSHKGYTLNKNNFDELENNFNENIQNNSFEQYMQAEENSTMRKTLKKKSHYMRKTISSLGKINENLENEKKTKKNIVLNKSKTLIGNNVNKEKPKLKNLSIKQTKRKLNPKTSYLENQNKINSKDKEKSPFKKIKNFLKPQKSINVIYFLIFFFFIYIKKKQKFNTNLFFSLIN